MIKMKNELLGRNNEKEDFVDFKWSMANRTRREVSQPSPPRHDGDPA